jgi:MFS transporter, FLVCR family, feline leukemia virus subgroup C receptor-related protein
VSLPYHDASCDVPNDASAAPRKTDTLRSSTSAVHIDPSPALVLFDPVGCNGGDDGPMSHDEQRRRSASTSTGDPHRLGHHATLGGSLHEASDRLHESLHRVTEIAAHHHKTRWVVLAVYCALSASNGFQWINYAPIIDEVKEYFEMDSLQVNFLATIYTVVYPALIIIGCVTFQRLGWYGGMIVGGALNALGAVLKIVGAVWAPNFAFLAFSQSINALSEVFFLSLPPLIASVWFGSHQRTLATSIGVMSNSLGTAFGFLIPPLVVTKAHHGASEFATLFGAQAVFAVLVVVASVLLPQKPYHNPSLTASKDTTLRDLLPSLRYLITHPAFVILAFASGLSNDSLGTFASFLAQLLQPFGVSELRAGWIGFAMTISGSVASTLVGVYIDRHRNYKATIMAFSLGAVSCFSILTIVLLYSTGGKNDVFGLCFFFITLMGGFLSAQIPLQLEYAVELTYPKPEAITTAFLLCLSGILTPLLTLGGTDIIGNNPTKANVINFMMGCLALSGIAATMQLFIRDHCHRVDIEKAVPTERHASYLEAVEDSSSQQQQQQQQQQKVPHDGATRRTRNREINTTSAIQ